MKKRAVVIGAVNMDICGRSAAGLIPRDSNPGAVSFSVGGVGHNIAVDLRRLGLDVSLIAAIGGDIYGGSLMKSCMDDGLDMSLARLIPEARSSCYLYINDEKGDLALAVCDTDISVGIDPAYLSGLLPEINSADALVVDGNLPPETLLWIARSVSVPIYADPVSVTKSRRLIPILPYLRAIKPNDLEAAELTGENDPLPAAKALIAAGVQRVFVTLGQKGMLAADGNEIITVPSCAKKLRSTAGAGDAVTAAMVCADLSGLSLAGSADFASRVASDVIASESPFL